MIGLLKAIASIAGGIMDVIIAIAEVLNNGCLTAIILIFAAPIYFPALGVYFICIGFADQIKRGMGKGNFYEESEGMKPFEYYISFGSEKNEK